MTNNALERQALEAHAAYEEDVKALYDPRTGLPRYPESELQDHRERLRSLRDSELVRIERSAREERALQEETIQKAQRVPPHSMLSAEQLQAATAMKAYVEDDVGSLSPQDLEQRLRVVLEEADKPTRFAYAAALRARLREMRQSEGYRFTPMGLAEGLEGLTESLLSTRRREDIAISRAIIEMAHDADRTAWSLRKGDGTTPSAAYMNSKYAGSLEAAASRGSSAPGPVPMAGQGAPRASGPPPGRSRR